MTTEFDPMLSLSERDIQQLHDWGFNSVRLGVMWPGVEPEQGQYNTTYIEVMQKIVNDLGKAGIYSIIDFHQDVISPFYCGEGVPDYIINMTSKPFMPFPWPRLTKPLPVDDKGHPLLEECLKHNFFEYALTFAASNTFQNLYDNHNGIMDRFIAYWEVVTAAFKDSPYVIGYELINEPWPGNFFANPKLVVEVGLADRIHLAPMYEKLHNAIRAIDDQHVILFEQSVVDYYTSGFKQGPGGPSYDDRQAYSYHVYCTALDKEGDPKLPFCNTEVELLYDEKVADYNRMQLGGFLTEFGAGGNSTTSVTGMNTLLGIADKHLQSWSYWQYKGYLDPTTSNPDDSQGFYFKNGDLQANKVRALSRTYARATAGTPKVMTFDATNSTFHFEYELDKTIQEPTEIYANCAMHYPNGLNVTVMPVASATWLQKDNLIYVTPTVFANQGDVLSVDIYPL